MEEPDRSQGQKYVYLTFDDGPSRNTQDILKVLDDKGVKATFFVIGNNAADRRTTSAPSRSRARSWRCTP